MFKTYKQFKNGGQVLIHSEVNRKQSDYKDLISVANIFAKEGKSVMLTPVLHHKTEAYKEVYGVLVGTKYDWKCSDTV